MGLSPMFLIDAKYGVGILSGYGIPYSILFCFSTTVVFMFGWIFLIYMGNLLFPLLFFGIVFPAIRFSLQTFFDMSEIFQYELECIHTLFLNHSLIKVICDIQIFNSYVIEYLLLKFK